jgi:glycosyltransferase involved in cell wall biosynthesis
MRTFCIIPARNEGKTIEKVIKGVRKHCDFVYVVDDGSTDSTKFVHGVDGMLCNPCNLGKGNSLRNGILWLFWGKILKEDDVVLFMDADGQLPTESIPDFFEFIKNNDMVVGKRDLKQYPFSKKFGNLFLSKWCSFLAGTKIDDSECGMRAIKVPLLRDILRYSSSRKYAVEMEMNIIAGRFKYDVKFVPIATSYIKGKGVTIKDGILNAIGGLVCYFKIMLNGVKK